MLDLRNADVQRARNCADALQCQRLPIDEMAPNEEFELIHNLLWANHALNFACAPPLYDNQMHESRVVGRYSNDRVFPLFSDLSSNPYFPEHGKDTGEEVPCSSRHRVIPCDPWKTQKKQFLLRLPASAFRCVSHLTAFFADLDTTQRIYGFCDT
jgi:hypothetical protein